MGNSLRHAQLSYARPDEECVGWDTENPDQKGYYLQDGELMPVAQLYSEHMLKKRRSCPSCSHSQCQAYHLNRNFYPCPSVY
jgi:ribosomal protein S27AE